MAWKKRIRIEMTEKKTVVKTMISRHFLFSYGMVYHNIRKELTRQATKHDKVKNDKQMSDIIIGGQKSA